jgi:hypothetical protein
MKKQRTFAARTIDVQSVPGNGTSAGPRNANGASRSISTSGLSGLPASVDVEKFTEVRGSSVFVTVLTIAEIGN